MDSEGVSHTIHMREAGLKTTICMPLSSLLCDHAFSTHPSSVCTALVRTPTQLLQGHCRDPSLFKKESEALAIASSLCHMSMHSSIPQMVAAVFHTLSVLSLFDTSLDASEDTTITPPQKSLGLWQNVTVSFPTNNGQ